MLETRDPAQLNSEALDQGYKSCRLAVKKFYKGKLWPVSNLPGDQRRAVDALLFNLSRTFDLLGLSSADERSLEVLNEARNELNNAFEDNCPSLEIAALVDASRRYDIEQKLLIAPLTGAELWIRFNKFDSFDELEMFCSYIGGSAVASVMPVLGVIKPGYEADAKRCGKAIMLTQILANFVNDLKQNRCFIAQDDLEDCEVDIPRLKLRQPSKPLRFLVRLYAARIEKTFAQASQLIQHLDFDGKRSLKSLLSVYWKMLMKMKTEPECLLSEEGVLTGRERLMLQSLHIMGIDSDLPIVCDADEHH